MIDTDNNNNNNEGDSIITTTSTNKPSLHCTFAITGCNETFQAIYICKSCSSSNSNNDTNMCFCEGCAQSCHKDHDGLEYIGMGLAYCDCNQLHASGCCTILNKSIQLATKQQFGEIQQNTNIDNPTIISSSLHLPLLDSNNNNDKNNDNDDDENDNDNSSQSNTINYLREAYMIRNAMQQHDSDETENFKHENDYFHRLQTQAMTLVQHSKETFWIDINNKNVDNSNNDTINVSNITALCDLEQLAQSIVQYHISTNSAIVNVLEQQNHTNVTIGGEWWVQVKSISPLLHHTQYDDNDDDGNNNTTTNNRIGKQDDYSDTAGIDLHYDKDEVLAETFGLGYFPFVSTVTYLTDNNSIQNYNNNSKSNTNTVLPTIIFNIRYDESCIGPEQCKSISEMILSYPKIGKHIVFDGRLLHGAPSNSLLFNYDYNNHRHYHHQQQQQQQQQYTNDNSSKNNSNSIEKKSTISSFIEAGSIDSNNSNNTNDKKYENEVRVTFLVNIWINHKPIGVTVLPEEIRTAVINSTAFTTTNTTSDKNNSNNNNISFEKSSIHTVQIKNNSTTDTLSNEYINLPFVSSGKNYNTTLTNHVNNDMDNDDNDNNENDGNDDDDIDDNNDDDINDSNHRDDSNEESVDEDDALIIRTYLPSPTLLFDDNNNNNDNNTTTSTGSSTILVQFTNPEMEAYLDYATNQST